jgi:hypothetical protein
MKEPPELPTAKVQKLLRETHEGVSLSFLWPGELALKAAAPQAGEFGSKIRRKTIPQPGLLA